MQSQRFSNLWNFLVKIDYLFPVHKSIAKKYKQLYTNEELVKFWSFPTTIMKVHKIKLPSSITTPISLTQQISISRLRKSKPAPQFHNKSDLEIESLKPQDENTYFWNFRGKIIFLFGYKTSPTVETIPEGKILNSQRWKNKRMDHV